MEFTPSNTPYIPFPPSHPNLRLTPPLYSDGPAVAQILNDPRVYMFLSGPPYPYTPECWTAWWPIMSDLASQALTEFRELQAGTRKWVKDSPVNTIREVNEDGSDGKYLGAIGIRRKVFLLERDAEEKKRLLGINDGFEAGDERIEWEFGFFLDPEAFGRGIMPVALKLLIEHFAVPYMNARVISACFWENNVASRRVFEKNGFEFMGITPDAFELQESKVGVKGKMIGVGTMVWRREAEP